jgi:hypothetical protein
MSCPAGECGGLISLSIMRTKSRWAAALGCVLAAGTAVAAGPVAQAASRPTVHSPQRKPGGCQNFHVVLGNAHADFYVRPCISVDHHVVKPDVYIVPGGRVPPVCYIGVWGVQVFNNHVQPFGARKWQRCGNRDRKGKLAGVPLTSSGGTFETRVLIEINSRVLRPADYGNYDALHYGWSSPQVSY